MQAGDLQISQLSFQTISSHQAHELHGIKMLMPALCRVKYGTKVIQWGEHTETANAECLIILPAGYDLHVANFPTEGRYLSEIVSLPPSVIQRFKQQHHSSPAALAKSPRFCVPLNHEVRYCWELITNAFQNPLPPPLLEHIVQGMLLTLNHCGWADIILQERYDSMVSRCQMLLMLDPGSPWTAERVASKLHVAVSTLHRRLAAEKSGFQEILDDVRLGNALNALQTTSAPIGEIARENGYLCPSRFTARFQKRFQITPRALRQAMKS